MPLKNKAIDPSKWSETIKHIIQVCELAELLKLVNYKHFLDMELLYKLSSGTDTNKRTWIYLELYLLCTSY